jgi:hypothetical protein
MGVLMQQHLQVCQCDPSSVTLPNAFASVWPLNLIPVITETRLTSLSHSWRPRVVRRWCFNNPAAEGMSNGVGRTKKICGCCSQRCGSGKFWDQDRAWRANPNAIGIAKPEINRTVLRHHWIELMKLLSGNPVETCDNVTVLVGFNKMPPVAVAWCPGECWTRRTCTLRLSCCC